MTQTTQDRALENEIHTLNAQIFKAYNTTEKLMKECKTGKYSKATKALVVAQGLDDVLRKIDTIKLPKAW